MDAGRSVAPCATTHRQDCDGRVRCGVAPAPRARGGGSAGATAHRQNYTDPAPHWLCFAGCMVEGAETGRAVLVGTNVVSLGAYPGTEERTVRVKIRNDGACGLKIEGVVLTCDCLRVDGYPPHVPRADGRSVAAYYHDYRRGNRNAAGLSHCSRTSDAFEKVHGRVAHATKAHC